MNIHPMTVGGYVGPLHTNTGICPHCGHCQHCGRGGNQSPFYFNPIFSGAAPVAAPYTLTVGTSQSSASGFANPSQLVFGNSDLA